MLTRKLGAWLLAFTLVSLGRVIAEEPPAAPNPDDLVRKVLDDRKVSLNFEDGTLDDVLLFLQDISGLNIVVDPKVDTTSTHVMLKVKDIALRNALDLMLKQQSPQHLMYEVWRGTVFITTEGTPAPVPPESKLTTAARQIAAERRITLNFPDVPLQDVVQFLADITSLNFHVAGVGDRRVRLRVKDVTLGAALDIICRLTGTKIEAEAEGEVNVFKARE